MGKRLLSGKDNTNGFQKNPQNINRSGNNKKILTTLTDYIEKTYGKRPPKGEVLSLLEYIECLPVKDLTEFIKDTSIPVIVQAYGRLLLSGDAKEFRRVQGAEMINDRIHGKPKQATELTGKDGKDLIPPTITEIEIIKTQK